MPIAAGDKFRVVVRGIWQQQDWTHVWHYNTTDEADQQAVSGLAADWWNQYKAVYRAMVIASSSFTFLRVTVDALQAPFEFGEYAIPANEQQGTRTGVTGEFMPTFVAAGVRFNVPNRQTRPGQKRIPGLMEADVVQNALETVYKGLVTTWSTAMLTTFVTSDPSQASLRPGVYVADFNGSGQALVNQFTSATVNPFVTTQNSRKLRSQ